MGGEFPRSSDQKRGEEGGEGGRAVTPIAVLLLGVSIIVRSMSALAMDHHRRPDSTERSAEVVLSPQAGSLDAAKQTLHWLRRQPGAVVGPVQPQGSQSISQGEPQNKGNITTAPFLAVTSSASGSGDRLHPTSNRRLVALRKILPDEELVSLPLTLTFRTRENCVEANTPAGEWYRIARSRAGEMVKEGSYVDLGLCLLGHLHGRRHGHRPQVPKGHHSPSQRISDHWGATGQSSPSDYEARKAKLHLAPAPVPVPRLGFSSAPGTLAAQDGSARAPGPRGLGGPGGVGAFPGLGSRPDDSRAWGVELYLNSVPPVEVLRPGSPLLWKDSWIAGCGASPVRIQMEQNKRSTKELHRRMSASKRKKGQEREFELPSLEELAWAISLGNSRAFGAPGGGIFFPGADLANHAEVANAEAGLLCPGVGTREGSNAVAKKKKRKKKKKEKEKEKEPSSPGSCGEGPDHPADRMLMKAIREIAAGEEVTLSYRPTSGLSASSSLRDYGFLPEDSPVELSLELPPLCLSSPSSKGRIGTEPVAVRSRSKEAQGDGAETEKNAVEDGEKELSSTRPLWSEKLLQVPELRNVRSSGPGGVRMQVEVLPQGEEGLLDEGNVESANRTGVPMGGLADVLGYLEFLYTKSPERVRSCKIRPMSYPGNGVAPICRASPTEIVEILAAGRPADELPNRVWRELLVASRRALEEYDQISDHHRPAVPGGGAGADEQHATQSCKGLVDRERRGYRTLASYARRMLTNRTGGATPFGARSSYPIRRSRGRRRRSSGDPDRRWGAPHDAEWASQGNKASAAEL